MSLAWLIMFASGHATSMGCEESLESSARAEASASDMKDECTFHSGKTLRCNVSGCFRKHTEVSHLSVTEI